MASRSTTAPRPAARSRRAQQASTPTAVRASRTSMSSRCRSRELARLGALVLGLGLGCSARHQEAMGDGGGAATGASGGGSGDAGSISLSGSMNVDPALYARCSDPNDLKCKKVDCPADSSPSTTSVSGKVYDPAGRVPLYN